MSMAGTSSPPTGVRGLTCGAWCLQACSMTLCSSWDCHTWPSAPEEMDQQPAIAMLSAGSSTGGKRTRFGWDTNYNIVHTWDGPWNVTSRHNRKLKVKKYRNTHIYTPNCFTVRFTVRVCSIHYVKYHC